MFSFRIFGIPVTVHPWFWITMAFIGGALRAPFDPIRVGLFMLAGFVSILVHELGHALLIQKYKLPTEIQLIAFGGYATHPAGRLSRAQSFKVSLAGPVVQVLLGGLVWIFRGMDFVPDTNIQYFLLPLQIVSIFWAILNLIPVFPLDGGQMLAAVLGPRKQHITYLVGTILPVILGILMFLYSPSSIIFTAFMALFAYQNWQRYQQAK